MSDFNPLEQITDRDLAVLRLLIREEVTAAVTDAVGACQDRQEDVRLTLFGPPDSPSGGLVGRVKVLETKAATAQWLAGMALGSSISAVIGLIMMLLTHDIGL